MSEDEPVKTWRSLFATLIAAIFGMAFAIGVGGYSVYLQKPPEAVPSTAAADVFSAERAMEHIKAIAEKSHPMGSAEAMKVRDYLVDQLKTLGLNPEVQKESDPALENIIGVLPGEDPEGPAVMLAAHYDSVPTGPGAGDDASGVAAILEAVRAIKAGPPLDNDLIVLITDGEEKGLLGAKAFVKHKEWLDRIGLVINFEGRGNRGPAYMFETSEENGWIIREFAAAHPHPLATSLAYSIYKLMPNNTDLTIFKGAGLKGLNFAFVEGVENYHKATDTPENLDRRSLQHQGVSALSLARHFSELNLNLASSESDAVYFHVMGPNLVVYPGAMVTPIMFAALAAFSLAVAIGLRPEGLTLSGLFMGALMSLLTAVLATAACWGLWLKIVVPLLSRKRSDLPDVVTMAEGLTGVALLLSLFILFLVGRRIKPGDLALGGLFWWLVLAGGSSYLLPGASYLFTWPLIFAAVGIGLGLMIPRLRFFVICAGSVGALILVPPTLQAICVALGPTMPYAAAPLASLLVVAIWPLFSRRLV